jgi:two-component system phosphate regulon sensor histidine kinase PhoR
VRARLFLSLAGLSALALLVYLLLADRGVPAPAVITIAISVAFAAWLARHFTEPLRRAAGFARNLTQGEVSPRLPETAAGETGDLYRALNRLAEDHRHRLEERGAERTETEVLLREMGDGVLALDLSGRVVRANAELCSVLGSSEPPEGRALATILRNPQLVSFLSPAEVPEHGRTGEFEVFGRIMLVTARRLPAAGVVAVFSDLTELRRLDTIRTEFVANASHELKTPLTAIRGFAETLLDLGVPDAERSTFAERIVEHADRMTAIVDDLLTLARLEDPRREIHRRPVAVVPLVERIVDGFSARLEAGAITTTVEVSPRDLELEADPEGLRQILENLIENAIRHANPSTIVVQAEQLPSGEIKLGVQDDGRGIPSSQLERIFERFFRVDPSRSRATGGTGLGLSIVKHWAEAMGGRAAAEGAVGEGTRVHVLLPPPSPKANELAPQA